MSDDEEIQNPPASIEIGTLSFTGESAPEKETESTAVVEEKTDTSSVVSKPDDKPVVMQPLSKEANDAYTTYIEIKNTKPSDRDAYAGIAVIIGGILLGALIFEDDYEFAALCCFGGCIIGTILIIVASTVQDKWKKEKNQKLEDALVKAGIPDIPRQNQKPLGISLLVIGFCALFMADFFYYNYIAETVVCFGGLALLLAGGIILANTESQNKKAMEKRVAILEEKRGLN